MKLIKGSSKGFFAVCCDTARHISQCLYNNEKWIIKWGNETLYYDSSYGDNVWEYYFKQTYQSKEITSIVSDYTDLVLLENSNFRNTMSNIFNNYFILNDKTYNILEPHFIFFNKHNVLGVHIRRTDKFLIGKFGTTVNASPVNLELFKKEIDQIVNDYEYIFLATDCKDACEYIKNIYGKKVIFNREAFRSKQNYSIHDNYKDISGYKKGLDVLCDTLLLSKCKHIIRSSSNVSIVSLYMNTNLTQTNLNVKYLNDDESSIL